jgi:metal-responsive CopG/Arc/MetJ family transcriptional regulator
MAAIDQFEKKLKIASRSEMMRNATENEFRRSKMATGGYFKNMKVVI